MISSSDIKKILLTTRNVRLDSGNYATKYYWCPLREIFFDVTGHTKTRRNTWSSATSIFFMNCPSAMASVAFSFVRPMYDLRTQKIHSEYTVQQLYLSELVYVPKSIVFLRLGSHCAKVQKQEQAKIGLQLICCANNVVEHYGKIIKILEGFGRLT